MTDIHKEIEAARREITRTDDGPLTDFVLIARACRAAAAGDFGYDACANALAIELEERGFLNPRAGEIEVPGS